ncbi:EamA family transporter [Nocardioides kongjuensis]|uniref:Drug/metabolite transporter (DMT)-like permease n=1 Tax=Nocardioides kongjuensis TaxID=349522 RepID=A0A852R8H7_9ACTN|nr:EamA family transporter [Nocardioides kongjuensis]NYD31193.1 drug/metabolite transporter (DMT)-like permease [Nocardioides kongjuensis]
MNRQARLGMVATALAIVYVVWGSTYLGIRVVVEDVPPLTGMGARFAAAGLLLGVVLRLRGVDVRVSRAELLGAALLGLMLPLLGNGLVAIGESKGAPSGVAALLVAAVPLWVVAYRFASGDRARGWSVLGVVLGFVGLAWLVLGGRSQGDVPLVGAAFVLAASGFWAFGSWVQPRLTLPKDPFVLAVHEMWTGGVMMVALGLAVGESPTPFAYDARTWLAWLYLVVIGSMVGFSAYVWLLSNAPIGLVATYAYVNPVVAVLLGWALLDEPITAAVLVGGLVIVAAVAVVITVERPPKQAEDPALEPA